ncbi:MAG: lipopolysaccharide biosynthesis protein [Bacteroidales bacterium]|nr:lipopolysaccharide biosynthesis protein [Bacteroidales bacterium]
MELDDIQVNNHIKKGFLWTSFNRFSSLIVQLIAMVVLARLLSPSDFALMGIVTFFLSLSSILVDSGMDGVLIATKNVEDIDYSTLFIYNLLISLSLFLLFFLSSGLIARFYNMEELTLIIKFSSLSIVISALGKIQVVRLARELRYKELGLASFCGSVCSLIAAILMALNGYGVWALIVQNLVLVSTTLLVQYLYSRYIPVLRFSYASFKKQWRFGIYLFLSSSLQTVYNNVFLLVFPKVSTLSFSGLYSQASRIQQLPAGLFAMIMDGAMFPILSKIHEPERFKDVVRRFALRFYLFTFFAFLALSLIAKSLVLIVLGKQWIEAGSVLAILCLSGIGMMVMATVRNIFKSILKTKIIFKLEIYKTVIGLSILGIALLGGDWIILWGIVLASLLLAVISIFMLAVNSNYKIKEQLQDIFRPLMIVAPGYLLCQIISVVMNTQQIIDSVLLLLMYIVSTFIIGLLVKNPDIYGIYCYIKNNFL